MASPFEVSRRLRSRLSRAARGNVRRPVLERALRTTVGAELAAATLWARRHSVGPRDPGSVTLAIKTFERPEVLRRMLASARAVFSGPIVVADDSSTPFVSDDPTVRVLRLAFDSGVAAGRNALIDAVTTTYVWMADDDMILLPDFDVARVVTYLERNPEVDLCGGRVVNLPHLASADYLNSDLFAYEGEPRRPRGTMIDRLPVSYKVPNFYVARTEALREVRYDDRLKRLDHTDFFTSAYGRLLCVHDEAMMCLHTHSYFDPHYLAFRLDTAADSAYLAQKWGGRGVVGGEGAALDTPHRTVFHRAALQAVADDLKVGLVQQGESGRGAVELAVADADRARFVDGLTALGWRRRGRRLVSPVWGDVSIAAATEPGPVREVAEREPPVGAREWVRWSNRAAWVDAGDALLVAALPLGPVYTLAPPGDLLWEVVGPDGAEVDVIVAEVLGMFEEVPADADRQIREHLDVLVARGLLVRG